MSLNLFRTPNCSNKFFVLLTPIGFLRCRSRRLLLFRRNFQSFFYISFCVGSLNSMYAPIEHFTLFLFRTNTFVLLDAFFIKEASTISACSHIFGRCCWDTLSIKTVSETTKRWYSKIWLLTCVFWLSLELSLGEIDGSLTSLDFDAKPVTDFDARTASGGFDGDGMATGASFFIMTGFLAMISFGDAVLFDTTGFNLKFPFGLLMLDTGLPTFGNLNGTVLLPSIESSSKKSNKKKHFLGYRTSAREFRRLFFYLEIFRCQEYHQIHFVCSISYGYRSVCPSAGKTENRKKKVKPTAHCWYILSKLIIYNVSVSWSWQPL